MAGPTPQHTTGPFFPSQFIRPGDNDLTRSGEGAARAGGQLVVLEGRVTDIQPAGDFATRKDWGAQRRDIRTFTVTARVPNPEHLLKDGMTAEVTIQVNPEVRALAGEKR